MNKVPNDTRSDTDVQLEVRYPDDGTSLSLRVEQGDDGRPFVFLLAREGTYRPSQVDLTPDQLRTAAAQMIALAEDIELQTV